LSVAVFSAVVMCWASFSALISRMTIDRSGRGKRQVKSDRSRGREWGGEWVAIPEAGCAHRVVAAPRSGCLGCGRVANLHGMCDFVRAAFGHVRSWASDP
jgi:hypothetical protein